MTDQHSRVYWTADRAALVEEGDARAAFLAYAPADPIPDDHLSLLHGTGAPTGAPAAKPLERMNKAELQAIASELGLDAEGTNRELVARISDHRGGE